MAFAFEVLRDVNDAPLGELGLGARFLESFSARGGRVEGYEWVYGGAARDPFPPHLALDGRRVREITDFPSQGSFPGFGFSFPGDHRGCLCSTVPVLLEPEELKPPSVLEQIALIVTQALARPAERAFLREHPERSTRGVDAISAGP